MNIVVISNACSSSRYAYEQSLRKFKSVDPGHFFFRSIINGLAEKENCTVSCLSIVPTSFFDTKILFKKGYSENEDKCKYIYPTCVNLPFIRDLFNYFGLKRIIKQINLDKNSVVIVDSLMHEVGGCLKYLKKHQIKTIACITDLPSIIISTTGKKGISYCIDRFFMNISNNLLKEYDSYIFMTKYMDKVVNNENKPNIIIDCIANPIDNIPKKVINNRPVVFYGGALLKNYGISNLIESCKYLEDACDVWLYGGNCDFSSEIDSLHKKYSNLKIHGPVSKDELHVLERNSSILINPRPIAEFTYYSFPSKTVEYLQMNVPVLMFKLPCLSKEYDEYIYYIEENTPECIANSIKQILNSNKDEISCRTTKAKQFIEKYKCEQYQCEKIYNLAKKLLEQSIQQ